MKKSLLFTIICGILLIAIPLTVRAVIIDDPLQGQTITDVIDSIMTLLATLGSGVAVIMIIVGGIQIITGVTTGEKEGKITKGKKTITWAIIGLAILWSAKFIIDAIDYLLTNQ
jgi:hypothetical protein